MIEALTYRHYGHSRADPAKYRPAEEVERWMQRDPLLRRAAAADEPRESMQPTSTRPTRRVARGDQGGRPGGQGRARSPTRPTAFTDVWADGGCGMAELITYREAVAEGIAREMRRDPHVVCLGEDIGAAEGVFKTTAGLFTEFGAERVWDTPISEQAIVGAAMGAAMTGMRPVAEIMFSDFLACCYDYLANEIPKMRYMTGGQVTVPLVIRTANGGGLGFGAQHSQAVENWVFTVPGLKIAAPSTPADVVGLMASAIRSDDPVIFFEHKGLLASKGEPAPPDHVVPLGEARGGPPWRRRHRRRPRVHRADRAVGGGAARRRGHLGRGDRPALPGAARCHRRCWPRWSAPRACSSSRRTRTRAAGAPRSSRSSPTRDSSCSTRRSGEWRRNACRCRSPTHSRTR